MSKMLQLMAAVCLIMVAVNSGFAQKVVGSGTPTKIPKWETEKRITDSTIADSNGNIGISTMAPGERLHLVDGNFLIEGGGETAIKIKRDFTITGVSGVSPFPIFEFGRITQAGDGDPELVFFYSDDIIRSNPDPTKREVKILEVDRKAILASVKPILDGKSRDASTGSHFEGFIAKEVEPIFRLNSGPNPDQPPDSGPKMRLEMGPGGATRVDVAVQREAPATLAFRTGTAERVRIDGNGNVGIGTTNPAFTLDIAGTARASNFVTSSDARLKVDISQLLNVLDRLERVRGVSFYWLDANQSQAHSTGRREIGVIAQELEAVFPELVTLSGEQGYRAVDYGRLTGVLIEAIKELRAEKEVQIKPLESHDVAQLRQITALQEQNTALASRVTALELMMQRSARSEFRLRYHGRPRRAGD